MQKFSSLRKAFLISLTMLSGVAAVSQTTDANNYFTPYSIFGVGNIARQGTTFNKSMGGIGIGVKENRVINYLNPAAISFRDTLAFMLDFGVESNHNYFKSAEASSANNGFNMQNFVFSFPIYKKSAMVLGITPYSSVGYKFQEWETDPEMINELGSVLYSRYGTGGINKVFLGTSMVFLKNFSVGAELVYFFGTIDRYSNINFSNSESFRSIKTGTDFMISSFTGKAGLQYSYEPDKDNSLTIGATYMLGSKLKGESVKYAFTTPVTGEADTVFYNLSRATGLEIPAEIGVGASYRKRDKWMLGMDFTYQDWSKTTLPATPGVAFQPSSSWAVKVGGEFIPNRYDVRYYLKRVSYRMGAYYDRSYISLNGKQVNSVGITIGANLPVYRWYNSVGISLDMGQRGSLKNGMVRERYIMLNLNISLYDIWFQKYRYD
ncbi:MAG: hypothetical protein RBT35_05300 [Bacteroidales bacterium]|nr:hypothetical protein [Bacteroidales bacterium]